MQDNRLSDMELGFVRRKRSFGLGKIIYDFAIRKGWWKWYWRTDINNANLSHSLFVWTWILYFVHWIHCVHSACYTIRLCIPLKSVIIIRRVKVVLGAWGPSIAVAQGFFDQFFRQCREQNVSS